MLIPTGVLGCFYTNRIWSNATDINYAILSSLIPVLSADLQGLKYCGMFREYNERQCFCSQDKLLNLGTHWEQINSYRLHYGKVRATVFHTICSMRNFSERQGDPLVLYALCISSIDSFPKFIMQVQTT